MKRDKTAHPDDGTTVETICRVCYVEFEYECTGSVIEEWSGGKLLTSVCHDCIDAEVREEQRNATTSPPTARDVIRGQFGYPSIKRDDSD